MEKLFASTLAVDSASTTTTTVATNTTRIVKGTQNEILQLLYKAGLRVASDPTSPVFHIAMDKFGPALAMTSLSSIIELQQRYPKYAVHYLVDLQRSNLNYVKKIAESGAVEVRHLEGLKANFAVTSKDYFCYVKSLEEGLPKELVWSNDSNVIGQMQNIYQRLWESGIASNVRIKELEQRLDVAETKLLTDPQEISRETIRLAESSRNEILIVGISEDPILRYQDFMKTLSTKVTSSAAAAGSSLLKMRLLLPITDSKNKLQLDKTLQGVEYRTIASSGISFCVYDRTTAVLVQYGHEDQDTSKATLVSAILTTNKETATGLASIFDALWRETELRDSHDRIARQANLLQDIITHDIRNYNQVTRLSAELLKEELKDNVAVQSIVESLLKATDGSTTLLERTKRLGKILAEEKVRLYSVDLRKTIRESLALVRAANYEKRVESTENYPNEKAPPCALADELLEEAFTNLFANSARYTSGKLVKLDIAVEEEREYQPASEDSRIAQRYWKVSIADQGVGIRDELKDKIFSRYLSSAKGTGLGMSIVHALTVQRYGGLIRVKDRVPGDYSQGLIVEILLPKAPPGS